MFRRIRNLWKLSAMDLTKEIKVSIPVDKESYKGLIGSFGEVEMAQIIRKKRDFIKEINGN